jgi:hypothetical protein
MEPRRTWEPRRSALRTNSPEATTYNPRQSEPWRNTNSPPEQAITSALAFRSLAAAGGQASSSAKGRARVSPRSDPPSGCIVSSPLASTRSGSPLAEKRAIHLERRIGYGLAMKQTSSAPDCIACASSRPKTIEPAIQCASTFPANSRLLGAGCATSETFLRSLSYDAIARSKISGSATGSSGTQSTGTRDRVSSANAVPCGPGVPLNRFTPTTRMLG